MTQDSKNPYAVEEAESTKARNLEMVIRARARSLIEAILDEELDAALGGRCASRSDAVTGTAGASGR